MTYIGRVYETIYYPQGHPLAGQYLGRIPVTVYG